MGRIDMDRNINAIAQSSDDDSDYATATTESMQVWINSVTGSDDNGGQTEATPKLTLEAGFDVLPTILQHHSTVNLRGEFTPASLFKVQKVLQGGILVIDGGPDTEVLFGPFTSDSASTTSIGDSGQSWTTDEHAGLWVEILDGPAAGETRSIYSNDATSLTISDATPWSTSPVAGARFQISQPATVINSSVGTRALIMSCTPQNTWQNYPHVQNLTFKGTTRLFHVGGSLVLSSVVNRATGSVAFNSDSPGIFFPASFTTNPITYGFDTVARCYPSFVAAGAGAVKFSKETGQIFNGGFILNGGSAEFTRTVLDGSNTGAFLSRIIGGNVSVNNCVGAYDAYKISDAAGNGLTLVDSTFDARGLDIDDSGAHAIEVDGSKLTNSTGVMTGGGNTGAGCYVHSQGVVHIQNGNAPTLSGVVGKISLDGITEEATWNDIDAGTAINGATAGNDEFVIIKEV